MKDVREALMVGRNSEGQLVRRPLSPHLQVYKPQLTSATSIFHRLAGVALGAGALLLAVWLIAAAASEAAFSVVQAIYGSWFGMLVMFGFTLALYYHLCNGVRHLLWDAGKGFELADAHRNGIAVIVATIVLTLATWIIYFLVG